jgi:hypothetical protein
MSAIFSIKRSLLRPEGYVGRTPEFSCGRPAEYAEHPLARDRNLTRGHRDASAARALVSCRDTLGRVAHELRNRLPVASSACFNTASAFGPMPWSAANSASRQRARSATACTPAAFRARRAGPDTPCGNAARLGCDVSLLSAMSQRVGMSGSRLNAQAQLQAIDPPGASPVCTSERCPATQPQRLP